MTTTNTTTTLLTAIHVDAGTGAIYLPRLGEAPLGTEVAAEACGGWEVVAAAASTAAAEVGVFARRATSQLSWPAYRDQFEAAFVRAIANR